MREMKFDIGPYGKRGNSVTTEQCTYAGSIRFALAAHAAWAPGMVDAAAWQDWDGTCPSQADASSAPALDAIPAMLRRRASVAGKMALEVACQCIAIQGVIPGTPVVFASRHGECVRSVELLEQLAQRSPLSPTAFSLSVHNASAGLLSIARGDRSNNLALAAGASSVEHAVIEACGLLADGAPQVILVAFDTLVPTVFTAYQDSREQALAWAWLLQAPQPQQPCISLAWSATAQPPAANQDSGLLTVLRFQLAGAGRAERIADGRCWHWEHHAQ